MIQSLDYKTGVALSLLDWQAFLLATPDWSSVISSLVDSHRFWSGGKGF